MSIITDDVRRALVTYVIKFVGDTRPIGKKAAQKFVHLVEDAGKVQTGYDFTIYTYGPFSRALDSELDSLNSLKAITVTYDKNRSSFEIGPGEDADKIISRGDAYISENKSAIDRILSALKGKSGLDLELYSTLIFLKSHIDDLNTDSEVVDKLLSIKPKYQRNVVERTLVEAKSLMLA